MEEGSKWNMKSIIQITKVIYISLCASILDVFIYNYSIFGYIALVSIDVKRAMSSLQNCARFSNSLLTFCDIQFKDVSTTTFIFRVLATNDLNLEFSSFGITFIMWTSKKGFSNLKKKILADLLPFFYISL